MKLRSKAPILREWSGTGHVSTDTSVSPEGKPMLVIDGPKGGPVEPAEAYTYGYEILKPRTTNWRSCGKPAMPYRTWGSSFDEPPQGKSLI